MWDESLAAWIRLTFVPGLGTNPLRKLLVEFGLPSRILSTPRDALARVVGERLADRISSSPAHDAIDTALRWLDSPNRFVVTLADEAYPKSLLQINDPPVLLYVQGDATLLQRCS